MSSIFSRIIRREIPGYIVAEDKHCIAFLDINPLQLGHTLVVPKKEVDYIFDLDDQTISDIHRFAKKVAVGMKKVIPCNRIGMAVIGLEVPHAHIHLVPINTMEDLNFELKKLTPSAEELKRIADKLTEAIRS